MNATFYRRLAALLAEEIAKAPNDVIREELLHGVAPRFADTLASLYASFRKDKFLAACQGVDSKLARDASVLSRVARL